MMGKYSNSIFFLMPRESLARFGKIERALFGERKNSVLLPEESYALALFRALCRGHQETVIRFDTNGDGMECPVAWDKDIDFPSLPSFIADTVSYAEHICDSPELRLLIFSFKKWVPIASQEIRCACGTFKFRSITLEIMARSILEKRDGNAITLKVMFGVRTNDRKHNKHHYQKTGSVGSCLDNTFDGKRIPARTTCVGVGEFVINIDSGISSNISRIYFTHADTFQFDVLYSSKHLRALLQGA